MVDKNPPDWIDSLKARGLNVPLSIALDVLEPLGPLGAQLIWAGQPVLGLLLDRGALNDVAQALEAPGGVEALRRRLEE